MTSRNTYGPPPTSRYALSRRLLQVTRPVLAPLALSTIFRLIALLVGTSLFALGGWALTTRAVGAPTWSMTTLALVLITLSLAKGILRYLEQYSGHYVAFRSLALLRNYFYDRLEPQAPSQTEGHDSGDLMSRVTKDIDRIEVFFAHTLAPATTALLAPIIVLLYVGVTLSWVVTITIFPFLLAAGVIVPLLGGKTTDQAALALRVSRGKLAHHVTDSVQGVREINAFAHEERRLAEMSELEEEITSRLHATTDAIALRRGINQALLAGALLTVFLVSTYLIRDGILDVGQLGIALGLTLGLFPTVLAVEDFSADLDQAYASARRVFAVTDRVPLVKDPQRPRDSDVDQNADLRFSHVHFRYPTIEGSIERPEVLHDITLTIERRKVTAIVGTSGSGKSTVASLIDRIWDPTSGTVALGGIDIADITQRHLREIIAYAPQHPHIFNDSVKANLLLAKPDATDAELEAVCASVGLDKWLAEESEGMETVVGELGERISGGQRQRLALARTLLRASPITILDEATSQIDADTEKIVLAGIREATQGSTLVIIAHRISTIEDADTIVVMDAGRIVEQGTFEELMANNGAFAALRRREYA